MTFFRKPLELLRRLLANVATLLLSLALALIIWVNAVQEGDPTISNLLQLPVTFVGMPENGIMQEPDDGTAAVTVRFEGPTSIVSTLDSSDFQVTADLSAIETGSLQPVTVTVQTGVVGIELDPPSPEQVDVLIAEQQTRMVPVNVDVRGEVGRGHTMGTITTNPAEIEITGTATEVSQIDFARATVFLNDDNETLQLERPLIFYDLQGRVASVRGLEVSTEAVEVTIPINESSDFAEKIIVVDVLGEPAPGYRLLSATVDPRNVLVTGRPTQLEQPFIVRTETIDITGLTEPYTTQVSLVLPDGISLADLQEEINVSFQIEPFDSTKIYNRPIELLGLDPTYTAAPAPEQVRVILFGPSPVLEALTDAEVRITVDLFDLEPGVYALEPVVDIPDRGLEVRSIQPSTISVEITQTLTATLGISNSLEISGTVPLTDSQRLPKPDDNLLSQVSGGATAVAAPAAIRVQRLFIDLPRQVLIL
jgi:YbbR domain-containing protein